MLETVGGVEELFLTSAQKRANDGEGLVRTSGIVTFNVSCAKFEFQSYDFAVDEHGKYILYFTGRYDANDSALINRSIWPRQVSSERIGRGSRLLRFSLRVLPKWISSFTCW